MSTTAEPYRVRFRSRRDAREFDALSQTDTVEYGPLSHNWRLTPDHPALFRFSATFSESVWGGTE